MMQSLSLLDPVSKLIFCPTSLASHNFDGLACVKQIQQESMTNPTRVNEDMAFSMTSS